MSVDLSLRTRNVLSTAKALLQNEKLKVERAAQKPAMQELLAWCGHHGLDTRGWFGQSKVCFDRIVMQTIERTLKELNIAGLDDLDGLDRIRQSDKGAGEYKTSGPTPMQQRVLMAQANCGSYFPEWVNESPSQWVMDIDWQTLQLRDRKSVV